MSNKLVAYFSASGTTGNIAKKLAESIGADLYEIKPAVKYTSADLNWNNRSSRSSIEMRDKSSRPELADKNAKISGHDVIFLGFPIWWYVAPTIINTFLESYDFTGKKIILFATSGGSGFGQAVAGLQPSAPGAKIVEGKLFNRSVSPDELKKWAESF
ncbi:MAG: NAD(P)H-dependent oxidoreductase [Synergistaceae bacterium]|nr:NAD(P)H-dependent oxidoreductase [Synergistaceae bacterium]